MSLVKWLVFRFVPYYIGLYLLLGLFMWMVTGSISEVIEFWPLHAILCVPITGLIAAHDAIPPGSHD